jgi:hypothetical protein
VLRHGEWQAHYGLRKPGAGGGSRTLTGLLSPADFLTVYGFRRPEQLPLKILLQVCGLDYPFTISRMSRGLGAARLVSTPSRLTSPGLARDCLIKGVPPNLSSSTSPVSRRALKFFSSPLRLPFRHARVAV